MIPHSLVAVALYAGSLGTLDVTNLEGTGVRIETSAHPATVVVFISTVCPMANDYTDRLRDLVRDYQPRGVRIALVYANRTESLDEIRRHAQAVEFDFPVYRDEQQRVADLLHAAVTPTAYVIDRAGRIRYTGKIDDSVNPARVKRRWLGEAIDAVVAGRGVEVGNVAPYG